MTEYATYLNSFGTVFTQLTCPQGMSTIENAVGNWNFCYPSGTPIPVPPEQLKTDLNECGLKVTTQVPWVLVSVPTMTSVAPAQSTQVGIYSPNTFSPTSPATEEEKGRLQNIQALLDLQTQRPLTAQEQQQLTTLQSIESQQRSGQ